MSDTAPSSSERRSQLWVVLLTLAAVALAAWLWFGWRAPAGIAPVTPVPPVPQVATAPASSAAPAPLSASQVQRGIERARDELQRNPKDAAAWAMLAHTHEMAGQFKEAAEAYRRLLALRPQDAQAHADFADALGVASQGSLQGEPAKLITRALELEPANFKALVLAGKEAFERRQYAAAVGFWERALKATGDAALQRPVATSIAEARALMAPTTAGPAASATAQPFVAGRVTLASALKGQVGPEDTVFVFARPADGSRMPVALLKKRGRDLPLDFALDDTLAMTREARISQHAQLRIGARVSKRGDAIPAAGDIEAELGPVPLGSTGLALELSHVRP